MTALSHSPSGPGFCESRQIPETLRSRRIESSIPIVYQRYKYCFVSCITDPSRDNSGDLDSHRQHLIHDAWRCLGVAAVSIDPPRLTKQNAVRRTLEITTPSGSAARGAVVIVGSDALYDRSASSSRS